MYKTFSEKNREIAEKLNRKIENSPITREQNEPTEVRGIDDNYRDCIEKLKNFKVKNEKYAVQITRDLEKIEDIIFSMERTKNKTNDPQTQSYENFEKFIQAEQVENYEKMNAVRKGMIENLEKKKKTMKADTIEIIEQEFEIMCKTNLTDLEKKTNALISLLEEEKITQTIGEEILKMEQMISQEREARKAQNQTMFELISEIEEKIDSEIREEARLREKCEETMESRLEEICYRIEAKVLGTS